jgi:cell wall assembly regulator SMI1
MTPADITTIEEELGVDLPSPFVEAALSGAFTDTLHDHLGSIVGINTSFRSGDFGDQDWNKNLIAFGHDGAGNYFCIDVLNIGDGVFVRDHETLAISKEHDSFSDFLQQWS